MFSKSLCSTQQIFITLKRKLSFAQQCTKLLKGEIFARDRSVCEEDVCCNLNTRKVQDHQCQGPQSCYLEPTSIKLIIHGWLETCCMPQYKLLEAEYLQKESYNVIRVDWSRPASLSYIKSVQSSVSVGKLVARFLVRLLDARITSHEKIHIIGYSIGAHIAGIAGKEVNQVTKQKVGRITGLDPAKQLFEVPSCPPEVRLDCTDASMVDITHTDCLVFGFKQPLGTVDFYINGIGIQPGCAKPNMEMFTSMKELDSYVFCSHRRSCKHFTESINGCETVGWKCDSLKDLNNKCSENKESVVYGESTPATTKGLYFVEAKNKTKQDKCR